MEVMNWLQRGTQDARLYHKIPLQGEGGRLFAYCFYQKQDTTKRELPITSAAVIPACVYLIKFRSVNYLLTLDFHVRAAKS